MATINTIHDLLELLRSEPVWVEELRAILLTKEVLELPAAVASLTEALSEANRRLGQLESDMATVKEDVAVIREDIVVLKDDMSGVKEDMSGVKEDMSGVKEDMSGLTTRVARAEGHLGRLLGKEYERSVEQAALARTIIDLGFNRVRVSMSQNSGTRPEFHRAIDYALESGNLSVSDVRSIFDTDLIISSGDGRYALFEVSVTAGSEDISRARARAEILAGALASEVTPAVITSSIQDPQQLQADEAQVKVIIIPDD